MLRKALAKLNAFSTRSSSSTPAVTQPPPKVKPKSKLQGKLKGKLKGILLSNGSTQQRHHNEQPPTPPHSDLLPPGYTRPLHLASSRDGSAWSRDIQATRTLVGIPTVDPPVYSHPHSVPDVAREAARFAMHHVLQDIGDKNRPARAKTLRFTAHTAYITRTAAFVCVSAQLSYVALLAAATAIEGVAMLCIDTILGGFPIDGLARQHKKMVLDTAVATAVAAADGFESTKASPDAGSNWNQQGPRLDVNPVHGRAEPNTATGTPPRLFISSIAVPDLPTPARHPK